MLYTLCFTDVEMSPAITCIYLLYCLFSDCPQVHCIQKYIATEPDELTLEESDVINVFKKMADGNIP